MNKELESFKEVMHQGMLDNFKRDGELAPILFFYSNGKPYISIIPDEFLNSIEGKNDLACLIKDICQQPTTIAAGIIIEANGAKVDENSEIGKLMLNGDMRVSEYKEKQDLILMMFSTPEKEETFVYEVDIEGDPIVKPLVLGGEDSKGSGLFSGFFNWNIN